MLAIMRLIFRPTIVARIDSVKKTILIHEGTIYELKSGADVEWSLLLEVSVRAEDGSNSVEVREITVPVTGGNAAAILEKVASSGTVSDGRVTSG